MPIVHHSVLYPSTSPPVLLLPAPPKRLMLPAPKIAGLLSPPPAPPRTTSGRLQGGELSQRVVRLEVADTWENAVRECRTFDELLALIGPIRPKAELEAEFLHIPVIRVKMLVMHHPRRHMDRVALIPIIAFAADL